MIVKVTFLEGELELLGFCLTVSICPGEEDLVRVRVRYCSAYIVFRV